MIIYYVINLVCVCVCMFFLRDETQLTHKAGFFLGLPHVFLMCSRAHKARQHAHMKNSTNKKKIKLNAFANQVGWKKSSI